jgi:hypothetical protein
MRTLQSGVSAGAEDVIRGVCILGICSEDEDLEDMVRGRILGANIGERVGGLAGGERAGVLANGVRFIGDGNSVTATSSSAKV